MTGATGFIGRAVTGWLAATGRVRVASRSATQPGSPDVEHLRIATVDSRTDWSEALDGVDSVIHLAAIAHRPRPDLAELRAVNVEGLQAVARQAAEKGVSRFVLMSSIGVHGQSTSREAFTEASPIRPQDDYARSKAEAEESLQRICADSRMRFTILRPPLVYGPGAPGNFARLVSLVRRRLPLPIGRVDNRRSMLGIDNLASLIKRVLERPAAENRTYVVADEESVSTVRLVELIGAALGIEPRIVNLPVPIVSAACSLIGRGEEFRKLTGSLVVDSALVRQELGWSPVHSAEEGIREAVRQLSDSER